MTREDLILALHDADRPDRELDVLIALFIDFKVDDDVGLDVRRAYKVHGLEGFAARADAHMGAWRTALPRWTTSVDAAIALARQLAPGRSIELGEYVPSDRDDGPSGCYANVDTYCMGDGPRWEGGSPAPSLARAVVIAALEELARAARTPQAPPAGPMRLSEGVQARMSEVSDDDA